MREKFVEQNFNRSSLLIIYKANEIIGEYKSKGFTLTLRQLYYQFVARDIIPNKQTEYKRLGSIVSHARLAGLVDWDAIEDRTRFLRKAPSWDNPQSGIDALASQYQEDPWRDQPRAVEAWIEKDALVGVIEPICEELRIPYFACRGYASQSEVYGAGKRLAAKRRAGREPLVLHLGDHDPSGLDMTRDNADRLTMFARLGIEVRRLALNRDQIDRYNPPPNPAKETDARFAGYREEHGDESWELDALDPEVIADLIGDEVRSVIDEDAWNRSMRREADHKAELEAVRDRWSEVVDFLKREPEDDPDA